MGKNLRQEGADMLGLGNTLSPRQEADAHHFLQVYHKERAEHARVTCQWVIASRVSAQFV